MSFCDVCRPIFLPQIIIQHVIGGKKYCVLVIKQEGKYLGECKKYTLMSKNEAWLFRKSLVVKIIIKQQLSSNET